MNVLYDFYSELLTEKQREYMALYYREDYSLGEIAQLNNVSRQAVYDNIRRTEQVIETYEEKLQLYKKHEKRQHLFKQLQLITSESDCDLHTIKGLINQLTKIE